MKFIQRKLAFGRHPEDDAFDDDGTGLPAPLLVKLAARRAAGIKEAQDVLKHLPGPGEGLHALCTARMDLTDVVNVLLQRLGKCERVYIATLGFNSRNLKTMTDWLDSKAVMSLTLLSSIFLRSHKTALWEAALKAFRDRGQRAAAAHSHAKIVTMQFEGGGKLVIEGSANLCGNGSGREQFALINEPALCDWHAKWIDQVVSDAEGKAAEKDA